ncbi:MAG: hypothetical protein R6V10_01880, partial [bacterium]
GNSKRNAGIALVSIAFISSSAKAGVIGKEVYRDIDSEDLLNRQVLNGGLCTRAGHFYVAGWYLENDVKLREEGLGGGCTKLGGGNRIRTGV